MPITLRHDPTRTSSHGLWECPHCGGQFHGNGPPGCGQDCPRPERTSYAGLTYVFGTAEVAVVLRDAARYGDDMAMHGPLSVRLLRDHGFHELLQNTPAAR